MKKILYLLVFLASSVSAAVISTECRPGPIKGDNSEWLLMHCVIDTTDAGSFNVEITTSVARMRANADGSIREADKSALLLAIQAAYRARVVALRAEEAIVGAIEAKRRVAAFKMTPGEIE